MNVNDVPTLNNFWNILKELKKYKEAIFYYEKALKINPQDIVTNYNFTLLFNKLEEFQKSVNKKIEEKVNTCIVKNEMQEKIYACPLKMKI